ncbi:MAG TPA: BatA domain-containing protein [Phycisphaerales bacterium]|nr:BatA domain-containing protein [Phycisphaerales bacterium]
MSPYPLAILALSFVTPALAAAGVAAVAIPIIIHLLTRRHRTPIAWGAMKFLLEAYKKHRRRLTLEQLLLLACRCLLVATVGVALARPHMADVRSQGPIHLYLLLDNSLTSAITQTAAQSTPAGVQVETALDRYKARAKELLKRLDATRGDRAAILTLSAPAAAPVIEPSTDFTAIARVIDAVTSESARADLAGALARIRAELAARDEKSEPAGPPPRVLLAILSDQRRGSVDLSTTLPSLGTGPAAPTITALEPAADDLPNTAVLSVQTLRPIITLENQGPAATSNQVRVTLKRFNTSAAAPSATPVTLWLTDDPDQLPGQPSAQAPAQPPAPPVRTTIRWTPGQEIASAIVDVPSPGSRGLDALTLIARIDADRLPADDIAARSITARRAVRVAVVESIRLAAPNLSSIDHFTPGDWLRLLLQPDTQNGPLQGPSLSGLAPTTIDPATVGRSGLAGFDAAVILAPDELAPEAWERLADFSRSGGVLFFTPSATQSIQLWTDLFLKTFGLDWTIAREAVDTTSALRSLAPDVPGGTSNPLLGLLAGEMDALTRPVTVFRALRISAPAGTLLPIINFADGTPFVAAALPANPSQDSGRHGLIILLASAIDLSWSDLPTKPLMLPLLHEALRVGVGQTQPTFDVLAGASARFPQGAVELAPADPRAHAQGAITTRDAWIARAAGLWRARSSQGATLTFLAVNPDTAASDTTPITPEQSREFLAQIAGADRLIPLGESTQDRDSAAAALAATSSDQDSWGLWLLLAALVLALLEMVLARRFSHAQRQAPLGRMALGSLGARGSGGGRGGGGVRGGDGGGIAA